MHRQSNFNFWQNEPKFPEDATVASDKHRTIADFGHQLSGREKAAFMRALHALAWQE